MFELNDIKNCVTIGGVGSVDGPSPFAWAKPVLQCGNTLLLVHRYSPDGAPAGDQFLEGKWRQILGDGSAFLFIEIAEALHNGMIWMFRQSFYQLMPGVDVANKLAKHNGIQVEIPGATANAFLVNEKLAQTDLEEWKQTSYRTAWHAAIERDWLRSQRYADLSFLLTSGFDPDAFALFYLATKQLGDVRRANWELDVARRSCGAGFVANVLRICDQLRQKLGVESEIR